MITLTEAIKERKEWSELQKKNLMDNISQCDDGGVKNTLRLAANYFHGEIIAFNEILLMMATKEPAND